MIFLIKSEKLTKILKNKNLYKIVLLFLLVIFSLYTYCYFEDKKFEPQNLGVSSSLDSIMMVDEKGNPIDPGLLCSLTQIDDEHLVFCNYQQLFLLHLKSGKTKILSSPSNIVKWNPTGLKYNKITKTLYVANYKGKDVLLLGFDEDFNLILKKRYEDIDLLGPENVDITGDGKICAIADYDSSKLVVFKGDKKAWSASIGGAHGVSFSQDEKLIYVTSLSGKKVYIFDLQGKVLKVIGKSGWKKDGYLWPTSISVYQDKVAISDAHTGKLTILSPDLNPQKSMGGNGPGIDLFNMPYGIEYTPDGMMYVIDTFKGRIIKIDPQHSEILKMYEGKSTAHMRQPSFTHQVSIKNFQTSLDLTKAFLPWCHNYMPLGSADSYKGYSNKINSFSLHYPYLTLPQPWRGEYRGITFFKNRKSKKSITLSACGFVHDCYYYWTFGGNYDENDDNFTIIGSPQMDIWLVLYEGILCPVHLGLDFWIESQKLISSRGELISFKQLVQEALKKINPFIKAVKKGDNPIDAMAEHLYGKENFDARFKACFASKQGKEFYQELISAKKDINKMRISARKYLIKINKTKETIYLFEVSIAHMLLRTE